MVLLPRTYNVPSGSPIIEEADVSNKEHFFVPHNSFKRNWHIQSAYNSGRCKKCNLYLMEKNNKLFTLTIPTDSANLRYCKEIAFNNLLK